MKSFLVYFLAGLGTTVTVTGAGDICSILSSLARDAGSIIFVEAVGEVSRRTSCGLTYRVFRDVRISAS